MNKLHRFLLFVFFIYAGLTCFTFISAVLYLKDDSLVSTGDNDYDKPDPLHPFDTKQNISLVEYKVLRRTKDGGIFIMVDHVPYHVASLEACPTIPLKFENVKSPSRLDNVPYSQDIQSFLGFRQLCLGANEDDVTDDGLLLSDNPICSQPPLLQLDEDWINRQCEMPPSSSHDHILRLSQLGETATIFNQRISVVHNLVAALFMNSAVEISSSLASKLWKVYDKTKTLTALNELGICMFEVADSSSSDHNQVVNIAISTPFNASELSFLIRTGSLRLGHYRWSFNRVKDKYFSDNSPLLTDDLPELMFTDTCYSSELSLKVNSAFISAEPVESLVKQTLLKLLTSQQTKADMETQLKSLSYITVHWDDTMVSSNEEQRENEESSEEQDKLAYMNHVVNTLKTMIESRTTGLVPSSTSNKTPQTVPILIIGDISDNTMIEIENQLNKQLSASHDIKILDISSLLSGAAKELNGAKYKLAESYEQAMFEIACHSTVFLGTRFKSFSKAVSMRRRYQNKVVDFVGFPLVNQTFLRTSYFSHQDWLTSYASSNSNQLPQRKLCVKTEHEQELENRRYISKGDKSRQVVIFNNHSTKYPFFAEIQERHRINKSIPPPRIRNKLMFKQMKEFIERSTVIGSGSQMPNAQNQERCFDLAPHFKFDIKLDDPVRHGGKVCSVAVVTALFGHQDKLHGYHSNMQLLRDEEEKANFHSCWFAFVDHEAAKNNVNPTQITENFCDASDGKTLKYGIWDLVVLDVDKLPFPSTQMNKNSRVPKMLMHRAFDYASYLIYHDSKLRFRTLQNVYQFIYVNLNSNYSSWVSPRHPSRPSLYHEARCATIVGLVEDGGEAVKQMKGYYDQGMPTEGSSPPAGLIEGEWHLRNLKSKASSRQGCDWFREYSKWNHGRDQLSFNYILYNISLSEWAKEEDTSGGAYVGYSPSKEYGREVLENTSHPPRDAQKDFFFEYRPPKTWPFHRVTRHTTEAKARKPGSLCDEPNRNNKEAQAIKMMYKKSKTK